MKSFARCLCAVLVAWITGCATGPVRGGLLDGFGLHSGSGVSHSVPPSRAEGGGGVPGPWAPEAREPRAEWERSWDEAGSRCEPGTLPEGWPRQVEGAEGLLAPFLECTSAGDFVALQQGVDMPLLVARLSPWDAVRLGALGPVRADAVSRLNRQRATFLVAASERYGAPLAQVLALFVLHSTYDDELREVLGLLAREKQLRQTLGAMPQVCQELEARGLGLDAQPERDFEWGDVGRGLGRAARDALASSELSGNQRAMELHALSRKMPPAYQRALDEVWHALTLEHFAPGQAVLGGFDSLTFGVPLGFYGLVAGTGQGLSSLAQGEYEQATRQLAPAALLVVLHTGHRSARALAEARGAPAPGLLGARGLPELRLGALRDMAGQLESRLGVEGLRELAGYLRARREAGELVAVGGLDAALALHEARGDVGRAQAWLSQAERPGKVPGAPGANRLTPARAPPPPEGLAALVDEGTGLTPEVLRSRLAGMEAEAVHPRLPSEVAVLERQRPSVGAPPPEAHGSPRWTEYVDYYEQRLGEVRLGRAERGPLSWGAYEAMRGLFARGVAFERTMVELLRADAALPQAQRRFLQDFDSPRVEAYVGVWKPGSGLRFADVLVIEQRPPPAGQPPRVETFSFKSRNFSLLEREAAEALVKEDASVALGYYGEILDVRRPSLQSLLSTGSMVPVQRVRLFYEGGALKRMRVDAMDDIVRRAEQKVRGVEVFFQ